MTENVKIALKALREQKYKDRLESIEKRTMIMLFATGGGVMLILFLSMTMMMGI